MRNGERDVDVEVEVEVEVKVEVEGGGGVHIVLTIFHTVQNEAKIDKERANGTRISYFFSPSLSLLVSASTSVCSSGIALKRGRGTALQQQMLPFGFLSSRDLPLCSPEVRAFAGFYPFSMY